MLFPFIAAQVDGKDAEIIYDIDEGQVSIGVKRQRMLHKANGEYIVFIDDDDLVAENYVDLILGALKTGPDCVGIHILHYVDSEYDRGPIIEQIKVPVYPEDTPEDLQKRVLALLLYILTHFLL